VIDDSIPEERCEPAPSLSEKRLEKLNEYASLLATKNRVIREIEEFVRQRTE